MKEEEKKGEVFKHGLLGKIFNKIMTFDPMVNVDRYVIFSLFLLKWSKEDDKQQGKSNKYEVIGLNKKEGEEMMRQLRSKSHLEATMDKLLKNEFYELGAMMTNTRFEKYEFERNLQQGDKIGKNLPFTIIDMILTTHSNSCFSSGIFTQWNKKTYITLFYMSFIDGTLFHNISKLNPEALAILEYLGIKFETYN
jgi:hypothetical protein